MLQQTLCDEEFDADELMFELDEDYSGEVEVGEFLNYFVQNKKLVRRFTTALEQQGETKDRVVLGLIATAPWPLQPPRSPPRKRGMEDYVFTNTLGIRHWIDNL